jgi:hypothetical protein
VKPSGKFGVMVCAVNSAHSVSLNGSRPLMVRAKNNSATSIRRSPGSRQAYEGGDDEVVNCVSGAVQPDKTTESSSAAKSRFLLRRPDISRLRAGGAEFVFGDLVEGVELRVDEDIGCGFGIRTG